LASCADEVIGQSLFAALHEFESGPSRHFTCARNNQVAFGAKRTLDGDNSRSPGIENDPIRT
jgi:hypothetical protein